MTEEWANRMYQYEVKPPSGAWEKIAASLDDSHLSDQFPSLLQNMAVIPPATAWEKISTQLNEDVTVRPKYRRIPAFIRYAAAAVVLALITFGSLQLFKNNNSGKTANLPVANSEKPVINIDPEIQNHQEEQELRDNKALEESKHTLAALDITPGNRNKIASYHDFNYPVEAEIEAFAFAPQNTYRDLDHADLLEPVQAVNSSTNNMASRYIMLITPDGNIIRMSKKLGDLVCCVSGEEQDADCKTQLNNWRSKIVGSQSHSTGNFMDILNLVNSLQSGNNH